jgi:hypothetical protein
MPIDVDEYRRNSLDAWDRFAGHLGARARLLLVEHRPVAAPIAEAYGKLGPGEQERVRGLVRERAAERLSEDEAGLDGVALAVLTE